jgi:hypothetical protein
MTDPTTILRNMKVYSIEEIQDAGDWALGEIGRLKARVAALEQESDKLQNICGCAYQMAGSAGAPARFLDALSDPIGATSEQVEALLPICMNEFDTTDIRDGKTTHR